MARRARVKEKIDLAAEFLEYFYPVHYRVGKVLEEVLGNGQLNRKQVAMLWLIRAEGIEGRQIRRKDIQRLIATWFEISGPPITRALRAMDRPPLSLVRLTEDPYSAREKVVTLTAKGERFLTIMVAQGRDYIRPLLAKLSPEEIHNGLAFFRSGPLTINDAAIGSLGTDTTSKKRLSKRPSGAGKFKSSKVQN